MNDEIDKYTKLAGLGLPIKTELASMVRANPQKSMGMNYLEQNLLKLGIQNWINPLVSTNTQSGNPTDTGGARTAEDSGKELTDEGEATRDSGKNDK